MPLPSILDRRVSARLTDAILSLQPTALWAMDDGNGPLRDMTGRWPATVTGTPLYRVAAPDPMGRGVTFGAAIYGLSSASIPQASRLSALCVFSLTDASAATRYMVQRGGGAGGWSWGLRLNSNHVVAGYTFQDNSSTHAAVATTGAVNDGRAHVALVTFDGTTVRAARDGAAAATSASLTGSWGVTSDDGISISAPSLGFPGTIHRAAYWSDRIVTDADRLWIHSIVQGG